MIIVNQGIGREKQAAASTSRARCSPSAVSSHHPRNPQVAQARPWEDSPTPPQPNYGGEIHLNYGAVL